MSGGRPGPRVITRTTRGRPAFAVAIAVLIGGGPSYSKPPTLTGLFPAGASRGQTIGVTASGTFDHWPVGVWVGGKGIEIRPEKEEAKLSVSIAADAEPGLRWLRLHDREGATSLRPIVVGSLPEVVEVEPNDEPTGPQALCTSSVTVNGRLAKAGDVDGFSVKLQRGQTLVADLEANRHLGSPMDAVLQVVSPSGFVLAQNDDDVGRDPRIVFEAPDSGDYIVRLFAFPIKPDSSIRFAGGGAFVYRLTLTTGGFLDYALPLAVGRDGPRRLEAVGWNIPESARLLPVPADDDSDILSVSHPQLAGTAEVRRVAFAATAEIEPDDLAHPQPIACPVALSGRIDPPGDRDAFRLTLRKDDKRVFRVVSRGLGRPLDPVLRLIDSGGKILFESDDTGRNDRDLERSFTAPADGEYRAVVLDLNGRGGPHHAYLFSVLTPQPDFDLTLTADRFDLTPGKPTVVTVAVRRKDDFSAPIEIAAEDLPEGVSARPVVSKPGDASARSVKLELTADDCACPGPFRIVGKAAGGSSRHRTATAPIAGFDARTDWPWIVVRPIEPVKKK